MNVADVTTPCRRSRGVSPEHPRGTTCRPKPTPTAPSCSARQPSSTRSGSDSTRRRRGAHGVPRSDGDRDRQPPRRAAARRRPTTRSSRTPSPAGPPRTPGSRTSSSTARGSGRDRVRAPRRWRRGDRGEGAARLRRTNPNLVVKGGLLGTRLLTTAEVEALADVPPREVLLARLAGGFQAPLVKAAGLFQAFTRNFAYGLKAYVDQRVEGGEVARGRRPRADAAAAAETEAAAKRRRDAEAPGEAEARAAEAPSPSPPSRSDPQYRASTEENRTMATMTTEELLDVFKNMTVLELNEFLKAFEEEFDVTAAAPVAVAAAGGAAAVAARPPGRGEGRVRRRPHRRRRQEDPGHQGGPGAHQPRSQGGQGPRRRRPEARPREGVEGRRREGQGPARRGRRHRRAQVVASATSARPADSHSGRLARSGGCHTAGPVVSSAPDVQPARRGRAARPRVGSRHGPRAMLGRAVSAARAFRVSRPLTSRARTPTRVAAFCTHLVAAVHGRIPRVTHPGGVTLARLASRERLSFSKLREVLELPDLIAVQRESFNWFLDEGVAEVLARHLADRGLHRSAEARARRPRLRPAEALRGRVPRAGHDLRAPALRDRALHERGRPARSRSRRSSWGTSR